MNVIMVKVMGRHKVIQRLHYLHYTVVRHVGHRWSVTDRNASVKYQYVSYVFCSQCVIKTWLIKHLNRGLEFLVILNRGERGGRANKKIWKKWKRNAILRTKNIYTTYFKNWSALTLWKIDIWLFLSMSSLNVRYLSINRSVWPVPFLSLGCKLGLSIDTG